MSNRDQFETQMSKSIADLREARTPWWEKAWEAIKEWANEVHKLIGPDYGTLPRAGQYWTSRWGHSNLVTSVSPDGIEYLQEGCAVFKRPLLKFLMDNRRTAEEWSAEKGGDDYEASRRHRSEADVTTGASIAPEVPTGTPVVGGAEDGAISFAGLYHSDPYLRTPSAADKKAERREQYVLERVEPTKDITDPDELDRYAFRLAREVGVGKNYLPLTNDGSKILNAASTLTHAAERIRSLESDAETHAANPECSRPLPPIMRRAVRTQKVFNGKGCTRTDGKSAPTTAKIMEGFKR